MKSDQAKKIANNETPKNTSTRPRSLVRNNKYPEYKSTMPIVTAASVNDATEMVLSAPRVESDGEYEYICMAWRRAP